MRFVAAHLKCSSHNGEIYISFKDMAKLGGEMYYIIV